MGPAGRRVRDTFVELADTLVDDFDIIDFLDRLTERCVELLGVDACGLLLVDHYGILNLVAASTEAARLLELFQLQNAEGPCLDSYRTGEPVQCPDLAAARTRWPSFAPTAQRAGYVAAHALPMRLREEVVGALNLFQGAPDQEPSDKPGEGAAKAPAPLDSETIELGQALANAATLGILHRRAVIQHSLVSEQLQAALTSRIIIEHAKGILSAQQNITVEEAFTALRDHARGHNQLLRDVAQAVIDGTATLEPTIRRNPD
jgi:GAF domain-containing protein